MGYKIGVLALQGAFAKHVEMLHCLDVPSLLVRYPSELSQCNGLIIPGGESTTMSRQIIEMAFLEPLQEFSKNFPILGTCAGMILMARGGILNLLDITVTRNAYGRQCDSFSSALQLSFTDKPYQAPFIRAPRITQIHSNEVQILASHKDEVVGIQQGHHMALSFHPELTQDPTIHKYFLSLCE